MGPRIRWLSLAALAAQAGCLLYTKPINRPPTGVDISMPSGTGRNTALVFTAIATDPDGDVLSYQWAHDDGPCAATGPRAPLQPGGPTYTVTRVALGPFCVWLRVSDQYGASGELARRETGIANAAPVPALTVQQPSGNVGQAFPLYSDFRLSAAASQDADGDTLTRTWGFTSFPDVSAAVLRPCAPTAPTDLAACFHADVPGSYQVALTVSDGALSAATSLTLQVAPDAPPCLRAAGTELPRRVVDPAEAFELSATIADDGDPWPPASPSYAAAGFPSFTWRIRRNGGVAQAVAGVGLATLPVAAGQFTVGDHVEITVEVADRQPRSLAACGDAPDCALTSGCAQRATWRMDYL